MVGPCGIPSMRESDEPKHSPFLAVCTTPNTFHSYNSVERPPCGFGPLTVCRCRWSPYFHEVASAVLLMLTCMHRWLSVCFWMQDIDIKRSWPGFVIAEPYVLVRSLPYTRGQVRRLSDPGFCRGFCCCYCCVRLTCACALRPVSASR